jgi:ATP-dependent Clp protease protease subunit
MEVKKKMPKQKFWNFKNAKNDPKIGELMIYGEISDISWWGDEVTPKQFKKDLDALGDIDELKVFINSPGGDVFAGQAIYSILNRLSYPVNVYIDGLAASAASIIAMVGDTIRMPKNAMLMIHNPWTWGVGYAADFRKLADDLDKIRESIIPVYQDQTSLESEEIASMMDDETWMTADEALEKGFIHEIEEAKPIAASIKSGCSWIKNIPEQFREKTREPRNEGLNITLNLDGLGEVIKTAITETVLNLTPKPENKPDPKPNLNIQPKVDPLKDERVLNLQEIEAYQAAKKLKEERMKR